MFWRKKVKNDGLTDGHVHSRMDEHFQMSPEETVRVDSARLRVLVRDMFIGHGVSEELAAQGAEVLVYADLRGITSHGVSFLLKGYLDDLAAQRVNKRPDVRCLSEKLATATLDGDRGLGVFTAPLAMDLAIKKAAQCGIGVVTMQNTKHLGAAGYHAMLAAKQDMIGMCMTAAGGNWVLPTLGREPLLGTNAIALASPAATMPTFVFDAATTAIAGKKFELAALLNKALLPGWIAEKDGRPRMVSSPPSKEALRRMLLPLGSTNELSSYKGFGLGMIVEILAGQLSFAEGFPDFRPWRTGHFFAAVNIGAFGEVSAFKAHMDSMLAKVCATKPVDSDARVWYAGLRQHENECERLAAGIPLHVTVVQWLRDTAARLGISFDLA